MTATLPNAGISAPIPDTFDFAAWMSLPAVLDPTGRALRVRNALNCKAEVHNENSMHLTLQCRDDRALQEDVGPPLQALFGYTND